MSRNDRRKLAATIGYVLGPCGPKKVPDVAYGVENGPHRSACSSGSAGGRDNPSVYSSFTVP
jgi:hypothetical protein